MGVCNPLHYSCNLFMAGMRFPIHVAVFDITRKVVPFTGFNFFCCHFYPFEYVFLKNALEPLAHGFIFPMNTVFQSVLNQVIARFRTTIEDCMLNPVPRAKSGRATVCGLVQVGT